MIRQIITAISNGVPKALSELITLGRTLNKRSPDVLADFDAPMPQAAPPKPSTATWSTYAAALWALTTWPTSPPPACSQPDYSHPTYTVNWEEPYKEPWRLCSPRRRADLLNPVAMAISQSAAAIFIKTAHSGPLWTETRCSRIVRRPAFLSAICTAVIPIRCVPWQVWAHPPRLSTNLVIQKR